jgi:phage N-6-adenine-methyltransferase
VPFGEVFRTSNNDSWTTPRDFFENLNAEFNFVMDAAALQESALCELWLGPDHPDAGLRDCLVVDWVELAGDGWIFLNPPYGKDMSKFMAKANFEAGRGAKVVALVPSRTDTRWWHDSCNHHQIRFIRGRLKFGNQNQSAPFPSALIIMQK